MENNQQIVTTLNGGLGNQLFQYAAGRCLALRLKSPLMLDISSYTGASGEVTPRAYELEKFNTLNAMYTPGVHERICQKVHGLHRLPRIKIYKERSCDFDSSYFCLMGSNRLIGYWQSHKYLSGYENVIASDFEPARPLCDQSEKVKNHLQSTNSVSIHVRRGDYVSLTSATKFHGVINLDYYVKAIKLANESLDNPHYFVFSDDIQWCKNFLLKELPSVTFVAHNRDDSSWEDLVLMGYSRHHIIANSSFSWWGAWLADQRYGNDRLVVAPQNWFCTQPFDSSSRFPEHWTLS